MHYLRTVWQSGDRSDRWRLVAILCLAAIVGLMSFVTLANGHRHGAAPASDDQSSHSNHGSR